MPIGGRTAVTELAAADPLEVLPRLHSQLDVHFRELKQDRQKLGANLPVFALEHGLSCEDLEALRASVRFAVARGFGSHYWRTTWLPFVVYAAECGYDYSGNEFWPHFDHLTPGWAVHGDRQRVRDWFLAFATAYGGAIPEGAFAEYFTIIAWPITHAVLPVYLQRNLAQLLYESRMGLTTRLLHDPEGARQEVGRPRLALHRAFPDLLYEHVATRPRRIRSAVGGRGGFPLPAAFDTASRGGRPRARTRGEVLAPGGSRCREFGANARVSARSPSQQWWGRHKRTAADPNGSATRPP